MLQTFCHIELGPRSRLVFSVIFCTTQGTENVWHRDQGLRHLASWTRQRPNSSTVDFGLCDDTYCTLPWWCLTERGDDQNSALSEIVRWSSRPHRIHVSCGEHFGNLVSRLYPPILVRFAGIITLFHCSIPSFRFGGLSRCFTVPYPCKARQNEMTLLSWSNKSCYTVSTVSRSIITACLEGV